MHDNVGVVDQKRSAVNAALHSSYGSHLSGTALLHYKWQGGGGVGAIWIWPYRSNTDANAAYVNSYLRISTVHSYGIPTKGFNWSFLSFSMSVLNLIFYMVDFDNN